MFGLVLVSCATTSYIEPRALSRRKALMQCDYQGNSSTAFNGVCFGTLLHDI
jgi:hypothetical protein